MLRVKREVIHLSQADTGIRPSTVLLLDGTLYDLWCLTHQEQAMLEGVPSTFVYQ